MPKGRLDIGKRSKIDCNNILKNEFSYNFLSQNQLKI